MLPTPGEAMHELSEPPRPVKPWAGRLAAVVIFLFIAVVVVMLFFAVRGPR